MAASQTCTNQGFMRCASSEYYQTCNRGMWGPQQSCNQNTVCTPSGNYIYCI